MMHDTGRQFCAIFSPSPRYNEIMFLDDSSIWPRKEELPPKRPVYRHEKALTRLIFVYLVLLLILPVSLGGMVDLIRYLFD